MEELKIKKVPVGLEPRALAEELVRILYEKQASDILLYHVTDTTIITDYEIICTGRASTHINALADELDFRTEDEVRIEGRDGGSCVLLDFGCVIVHIFARDAREFYKLERLLPEEAAVDISAITAPPTSENI